MPSRSRWVWVAVGAVALLGVGCPIFKPDPPETLGEGADYVEREVASGGDDLIALVVDPDIPYRVRASLDQFEADLGAAGYTVIERMMTFSGPGMLRAWLQNLYTDSGVLVGTILIGDVPFVYQYWELEYANPSIPTSRHEGISTQYYADLDGVFSASPGFVSPGGHSPSYDLHTGDVDWEIWVGVLPFYLEDYEATADALIRYLAKNHAYRTGPPPARPRFLQIDEHYIAATHNEEEIHQHALEAGEYAWTPLSRETGAKVYFDCPTPGKCVSDGYAAISSPGVDLAAIGAHSTGRVDTGWALNTAIRTSIFWHDGCRIADLADPDNFVTAVLYGPYSEVVAAKGSTENAIGLGKNADGFYAHNLATDLDLGKCLGEALLEHVNVPQVAPYDWTREGYYAPTIILGDPSLTLLP